MKKKVIKENKEIVATPKDTLCPGCKLPLKTVLPRIINGKQHYFCANKIDGHKCMADVTKLIGKRNITITKESEV
jgi:hypothetical protein